MDTETLTKIERTTAALRNAVENDCPALADLCSREIKKLLSTGETK